MPLPILAHQAPVLPLKLWRPAAWNGTALVVGSIAPDLSYLRVATADRGFAHSIVGQFAFCLPVTLAVVGAIGYFDLAEVLVARAPAALRARLAWLVGAATDVAKPGGFVRACAGALVGSFSHVVLDLLTHSVVPWRLPPIRFSVGHVRFTTPTIVQLGVSGIGALLSIWLLVRIAAASKNPPPSPRPGGALVVAFVFLGFLLGGVIALPALRNPDWFFAAGRFYVWGHLSFLVACGAAGGALLAGLFLASWDRTQTIARAVATPVREDKP